MRLALSLALVLYAAGARAGDIAITDFWAFSATPVSQAGAGYLVIHNRGSEDDRLIGAASDAATRVELHQHVLQGDVVQMHNILDGMAIPAGETVVLAPGGDHVMFMGLANPWRDGDVVDLTLTFERAGEIDLQLVVERDR